jgi:hypothetical protein
LGRCFFPTDREPELLLEKERASESSPIVPEQHSLLIAGVGYGNADVLTLATAFGERRSREV